MISIVIPALNEEDSIGGTIAELKTMLAANNMGTAEIVVVDDGSTDATAERARAEGATIVTNPHNIGYGMSLKRGIEAASNDTIVITDADLTYPADAIPGLVQRYNDKKFDMVVGQRTGENYRESNTKSPLRKLLKFLVEYTTGRDIPDINSGLRVFSRATVMPYFVRLCDTFSFTTSLTLGYMMTGRFVDYQPIDYRARVGKTKVRLVRDALRTLQYIIEAIVYYNPLKIFMLQAVLLVLLGVFSLIAALLTHIVLFYILGAGAILLSLVVFCFGLQSVLLKQILQK